MPGREIAGLHLLGYSYYMCGQFEQALVQFKRCVNGLFNCICPCPHFLKTVLILTGSLLLKSNLNWSRSNFVYNFN